MRYFYIIVLIFLNYSCSQKNTEQAAIIQQENKIIDEDVIEEENIEEVMELSGQIKKVQFQNKAGRLIEGVYDVYFVYQNQELFIKFFEGDVLRTDIDKYEGKNLTVQATIKEGLWDTNDENIQSRIGKYIVIYKIIK